MMATIKRIENTNLEKRKKLNVQQMLLKENLRRIQNWH
jgi:hypothetical protein